MSDSSIQDQTVVCELHQVLASSGHYAVGDLVRFSNNTGYNQGAEYRIVEFLPNPILFRRVNNCRCGAYNSMGKLQLPQEDCDICGYNVEFPTEMCIDMGMTHV